MRLDEREREGEELKEKLDELQDETAGNGAHGCHERARMERERG